MLPFTGSCGESLACRPSPQYVSNQPLGRHFPIVLTGPGAVHPQGSPGFIDMWFLNVIPNYLIDLRYFYLPIVC